MTALVWKIGERWTLTDIAIACMTVVAGALTLALALCLPRSSPAGSQTIVRGDGVGGSTSNLQLRENGHLLGPAHYGHVDIREGGKGRYSHWRERLWFSASDSTDPRSNGRSYSISVRASVHPLIFPALGLFDLLVQIAARRLLTSDSRFRRILAHTAMLAALVLAALIAAGAIGRVNEDAGASKDAALAAATLLHALLGCVILVVQWVAGAGLARLLLGAQRATLTNVLLLGFPLSLPLAAVLAVLMLSLPYGLYVAILVWVLCCLPLRKWRSAVVEVAKFARGGSRCWRSRSGLAAGWACIGMGRQTRWPDSHRAILSSI